MVFWLSSSTVGAADLVIRDLAWVKERMIYNFCEPQNPYQKILLHELGLIYSLIRDKISCFDKGIWGIICFALNNSYYKRVSPLKIPNTFYYGFMSVMVRDPCLIYPLILLLLCLLLIFNLYLKFTI